MGKLTKVDSLLDLTRASEKRFKSERVNQGKSFPIQCVSQETFW